MGRIDKPVLDESNGKSSRAKEASAKRKCLMCGDSFASTGAHNRVCKRCKSTQAWREGRDADS